MVLSNAAGNINTRLHGGCSWFGTLAPRETFRTASKLCKVAVRTQEIWMLPTAEEQGVRPRAGKDSGCWSF